MVDESVHENFVFKQMKMFLPKMVRSRIIISSFQYEINSRNVSLVFYDKSLYK